ncbi:MAG: SH3 domain-containing protein [Parafilimonas terrae]|nr:SH3 domain-containing protein [Parafilimonas terrae]
MVRRRRGSSRGDSAFGLVLLVIIGLPLALVGFSGGSPKPSSVPIAYAALPASTGAASGTLTYYGGLAPEAVQPAPVRPQAPAEPAAETRETLYVSGHRVPLRAGPDAKVKILDRYDTGQAVEVLERGDGWLRVRHNRTQREGWIQAKRLRDAPPEAEAEKPAQVSPALNAAAIAKLLIAESIAAYPGPCACPYQSARNGSSCGKRAAYVRPGGYAPLCFAKDITPEMVAEYRASH